MTRIKSFLMFQVLIIKKFLIMILAMIDKPTILNRNSPQYRELLWKALCVHGDPAQAPFVICNLCSRPVSRNEDWHESHIGVPNANGGNKVGIAHRLCNLQDAYKNVIPMLRKADRLRKEHLGDARPSETPLPFGRKHPFMKKTRGGQIVPRLTQVERHQLMMTERWGDWE